MYAVAIVFSKGSSIVTEIWVEIEAHDADDAIRIASESNASSVWRMRGYAIVNSAAIKQDLAKTIVTESTPNEETIVEAKPRRKRTPAA